MENKLQKKFFTIILVMLSFSFASAHVNLLQPKGGETFTVGSTLSIKWEKAVDHGPCTWELYFSKDGGTSWSALALNISKDTITYNWQIPDNTITSQGKIKVVQNNTTGIDYNATSGSFTISTVTGLAELNNHSVNTFNLNPAYPNPFNGGTNISLTLNKSSHIDINIYNILGKKVESLFSGELQAGEHRVNWNPLDLPSGVYYYTVRSGKIIKTQRLIYIK